MISLRSLRIRRFARDSRGAAAVEFALVTPLMLTMYFGIVEVSSGVAIDRKVTLVSHTLSDLVSQAASVNDTDITNVFNASSSIMTPYLVSPMTAKVTAVTIDGSWQGNGGLQQILVVEQRRVVGLCEERRCHVVSPRGPDCQQHRIDLGRGVVCLYADRWLCGEVGDHALGPVFRPSAPVDDR